MEILIMLVCFAVYRKELLAFMEAHNIDLP